MNALFGNEIEPAMELNSQDLKKIATTTLEHYNQRAEAFWEGTRDHNVIQNIEALLRHIETTPPFTLLDFGCGPGRDLKVFAGQGHKAVGLEGAAHFAAMARAHSGCEVWQQDFLKLELPNNYFDGVFSNASLFHIPSQELPRVLLDLHNTLKPGGVLFSSNPRGSNEEGWNNGRYGVYHDLEAWRRYMSAARFVELAHYYRPDGLPREQQPWLASVWRRLRP
jgi:SAM-dependent methyltransferase